MRELAKWEKRTHYIYCVHFAMALCLRAFLVSPYKGSRVAKLIFIILLKMVLSLIIYSMDSSSAYIRHIFTLSLIHYKNEVIF